jgi:hypothetical protein
MPSFVQVSIGVVVLLAGVVALLTAIVDRPLWRAPAAASRTVRKPLRITIASVAGLAVIAGGSVTFGIVPAAATPARQQEDSSTAADPSASDNGVDLPSPAPTGGATPVPTSVPLAGGSVTIPPTVKKTATGSSGQGSVSSIKVIIDPPALDCSMKARAVITVANPPVTLTYYAGATGVATGRGDRTITVTGNTATLAEITVDASISGTLWYEVLTPNSIADTRTWYVTECAHNLKTTITSASFNGDCDGGTITVKASTTVTGPPLGIGGTLSLKANSELLAQYPAHFDVGTRSYTDQVPIGPWTPGIERRITLSYNLLDERGLSYFGDGYHLAFTCGEAT